MTDYCTEAAIVGAGPAGSVLALALLAHGIRPLLIEQATFPRYHIGESLTGEAAARLRELGLESLMQQCAFPVKRGVDVWGANGTNHFYVPTQRRDAAKRLQPSTTWQVERETFDAMLLQLAVERGATLLSGRAANPITRNGRVCGVEVIDQHGKVVTVNSNMLADCSGQATFLAGKRSITAPPQRGNYDRQLAIFTQVRGARRGDGPAQDDTQILYRQPNHWSWVIPISGEIDSVGVVTPATYFKARGLEPERFLHSEIATLNPELTRRVGHAPFVAPVRAASNYSYHVDSYVGDGFVCVGDAHRFIDPIFSFGIHFAIHEALFAADAMAAYLAGGMKSIDPLLHYQTLAERGQNVIQDMVDCFWQYSLPFLIFAQYQYREQLIDLFAGRIYGDDVDSMDALIAMRRLLRKSRAAAVKTD